MSKKMKMTNILIDEDGNKRKDGAKAKPSDIMISYDEETYIVTLASCTKGQKEEIVNAFQDWADINDITRKRFDIYEDESEHEIVISLAKVKFCGSRLEDTTVELKEMLDEYPAPIIEDENDGNSNSNDGAQTKSDSDAKAKTKDNTSNNSSAQTKSNANDNSSAQTKSDTNGNGSTQAKSGNAPATKASDNADNKAPDPPKTKTPASYDFTKEEEAETDPEKFADSFLKRFGY